MIYFIGELLSPNNAMNFGQLRKNTKCSAL